MYVHAPKPSNAHQTFLDEGGFLFIQRCFQTLENRGLEDQGKIFTYNIFFVTLIQDQESFYY